MKLRGLDAGARVDERIHLARSGIAAGDGVVEAQVAKMARRNRAFEQLLVRRERSSRDGNAVDQRRVRVVVRAVLEFEIL